ncbi:erythromycin esterase family protein [Noviherbaspirillum humi]|nr:erythromycin esterase family protein [Noviherbaspirillum humi]
MANQSTLDAIRREASAVAADDAHDALLREIGDASIVLLGEATHGTEEFYRARARISQRLIADKGFDAIAVEADWPDTVRVSRYIRAMQSAAQDDDAEASLRNFRRFPLWMWRNRETVALIDWLRSHNAGRQALQDRIGFYGLDLYSLRSSMEAVVRYLQQVDPEAAKRARARYSCFDHFADDPQHYGYAASFGMNKGCEEEVVRQLLAMTADAEKGLNLDAAAADERFYAEQNARVARNAEAYYRAMFLGRDESWNLRDTHMADTLDALREHIGRQNGRPAKIVVWAHNSHIGDARATEMGDHGQINLGQLVRERHGKEAYLVGFTTHAGTVTAASEWDTPAELKKVVPSRPDSIERLFHDAGIGNFLLPIRGRKAIEAALQERRLERAIGVIYLPDTERISHYFHADIVRQFDAVIHIDHTRALHPLDRTSSWQHDEVPETFPSGI